MLACQNPQTCRRTYLPTYPSHPSIYLNLEKDAPRDHDRRDPPNPQQIAGPRKPGSRRAGGGVVDPVGGQLAGGDRHGRESARRGAGAVEIRRVAVAGDGAQVGLRGDLELVAAAVHVLRDVEGLVRLVEDDLCGGRKLARAR